jgi:HSP20 family protein
MHIYSNPIWQLRGEMDRLLSGVFGQVGNGLTPGVGSGQPAVNVWDCGEAVMVEIELPGVTSNQIDVSVLGDELTIKVERQDVIQADATYHRRERPAGSFTRTLKLPCVINAEQVAADLNQGVLTLKLPKSEAAKPRKINVASL